jgi:hypothetical protein
VVDFVKEWIDCWYNQDFVGSQSEEIQRLLTSLYDKLNHSPIRNEVSEIALRLEENSRQSSPQSQLTPRDMMDIEHNEFLDNLNRKLSFSNVYDVCKTARFLEMDLCNLAKQWTRLEAKLFKAIPLEEFYTGIYSLSNSEGGGEFFLVRMYITFVKKKTLQAVGTGERTV